MPMYSKILENEEILSLIPTSSKKILIVICGGCLSESLAYDFDLPISELDENAVRLPVASKIEATRLSEFLTQNGYLVKITSLPGEMTVLCVFPVETVLLNPEDDFNPDVILTLSCPAGALALKKRTDKPVFAITKQIGSLAFTYENENGKRHIIKERSKIDYLT